MATSLLFSALRQLLGKIPPHIFKEARNSVFGIGKNLLKSKFHLEKMFDFFHTLTSL